MRCFEEEEEVRIAKDNQEVVVKENVKLVVEERHRDTFLLIWLEGVPLKLEKVAPLE